MRKIKILEIKSEIGAGTRGAGLGPDALRIACLDKGSDFYTKYRQEEIPNLDEVLFRESEHSFAKYINAVYATQKRVARAVAKALRKNYIPLVLAGDHSAAAGTITGIKMALPESRLGVIWIDAHADLHSPYTTPSGNMHGMPLAIALNEDNSQCLTNRPPKKTINYWEKMKLFGVPGPKIRPEDLVFISLRDQEEQEISLIKRNKIKAFTPKEIQQKKIAEVVRETLHYLSKCDKIYVSFDVDSIDPSVSQGTGTPAAGGLKFTEAFELNTLLAQDPRLTCYEMAEINPTFDTLNTMAENAFDILEAVSKNILLQPNGPRTEHKKKH